VSVVTPQRSAGAARTGWRRFVPHTRGQWGLVVLGCVALVVVLFGIGYATTTIPSPNKIVTQQTATLYYADGHNVFGRVGTVNRIDVPIDRVPKNVQHAVLAAEDRGFYSESGVSPKGILRALWVDLRGGGVQQGGSTITQQYAKNAYLSQQRTFSRKFKEFFIAVKLSKTRSKDRILQDYLNTIYFGRGAYGIEAAARTYFGKNVDRLTTAEGAVLAASIRSPGNYDPALHPQAAKARWAYVIDGMVKTKWLSRSDADAMRYPATLPRKSTGGGGGMDPNGFAREAVTAELAKLGYDEDRLTVGGYRIVTTLDRNAQLGAIAAEQEILPPKPGGPLSALVSVQPGDGAVRAMYGGADFGNPKFQKNYTNLATSFPRQAGSSFKPYTLIAALQDGIGLGSTFDGRSPQTFPGYPKPVSNSGGEQCPSCTLVQATAQSVNTVFVPLAIKVGPDKIVNVAHEAGVASKQIDQYRQQAGITLGIADVSVLDQAVGYATIAAQGERAQPYLVAKIISRSGHVVYTARTHTQQVFPKDVMADTTFAMTKVLDCSMHGTACGKGLPGRPAAGKTGTTEKNENAWFIGFTPQLSTAVWIGMSDPHQTIVGIPGNAGEVFGGGPPAQIWQRMMTQALQGKPVLTFPGPAHVGQDIGTPSPTPTPTASATPSKSPSPTPSAPGGTGSPQPSTPAPLPTTAAPTKSPPGHAATSTPAPGASP
jgi:membrane peptidoglycan carboxypeptidase